MEVCTTETQEGELSVSSRGWSIDLGDAFQLEWYLDNRHGIHSMGRTWEFFADPGKV